MRRENRVNQILRDRLMWAHPSAHHRSVPYRYVLCHHVHHDHGYHHAHRRVHDPLQNPLLIHSLESQRAWAAVDGWHW